MGGYEPLYTTKSPILGAGRCSEVELCRIPTKRRLFVPKWSLQQRVPKNKNLTKVGVIFFDMNLATRDISSLAQASSIGTIIMT